MPVLQYQHPFPGPKLSAAYDFYDGSAEVAADLEVEAVTNVTA